MTRKEEQDPSGRKPKGKPKNESVFSSQDLGLIEPNIRELRAQKRTEDRQAKKAAREQKRLEIETIEQQRVEVFLEALRSSESAKAELIKLYNVARLAEHDDFWRKFRRLILTLETLSIIFMFLTLTVIGFMDHNKVWIDERAFSTSMFFLSCTLMVSSLMYVLFYDGGDFYGLKKRINDGYSPFLGERTVKEELGECKTNNPIPLLNEYRLATQKALIAHNEEVQAADLRDELFYPAEGDEPEVENADWREADDSLDFFTDTLDFKVGFDGELI